MNQEFIEALREIVDQKGISEDLLFETIEDALVAAYKKNFATLSSNSSKCKSINESRNRRNTCLWSKEVVEEVVEEVNEIS